MTLNARITLRSPVAGEDAAGQPSAGWQGVDTVWADALGQSGLQAVRAEAKTSVVRVSFRIRKRADVVAGWSVVDRAGKVFEVKAVLPDYRDRMYVDLVCEALP